MEQGQIMKSAVCILPARGGSKRIPRKNLLPLAGKPLLAYSVEAALESGMFVDVIVSSDDGEILDLARSLGATSDIRPTELSGDTVRFVQVVEEYLQRPGIMEKYDTVAGVLPTCPFRTVDDVRNAMELFFKQKSESFLISVTDYEFPPQLALDFGEDHLSLSMRDPDTYARTTRSQSIGSSYHPNGAIYIATTKGFLREKTFFADPLLGYLMPPERSFDIDYPYQFKIAEAMMQEQLRGGSL